MNKLKKNIQVGKVNYLIILISFFYNIIFSTIAKKITEIEGNL